VIPYGIVAVRLVATVLNSDFVAVFKSSLKTFLYSQAFSYSFALGSIQAVG